MKKLQILMVLAMVSMGIYGEQVKASTPHNAIKAQQSYKQNQGVQVKDKINNKISYIQEEIQFSKDNPNLPCCVGSQKPGIVCRWCTSETPELKTQLQWRQSEVQDIKNNVQNKANKAAQAYTKNQGAVASKVADSYKQNQGAVAKSKVQESYDQHHGHIAKVADSYKYNQGTEV